MNLTTYYTPSFSRLATFTIPRMERYAKERGWTFSIWNGLVKDNPIWAKIDALLACYPEPAVWMDVDCLIMDMSYDLSTDRPLRTALDGDGLCACVLSVGNQTGWDLIKAVRTLGDVNDGYKQDQSTLRHLIENFKSVADAVTSDILVSDVTEMRENTPIYHAWATARDFEAAVNMVRKISSLSRGNKNSFS